MTTLPHPLLSHAQNPFGIAYIHAALLESSRVTLVSLFWLAALPFAAAFSVAATVYDRLMFLRSTAFRLPCLRNHFAIQPLILKRKGVETTTVGRFHSSEFGRE